MTGLISALVQPESEEADTLLVLLLGAVLLEVHTQSCDPTQHETFSECHPLSLSLLEGISLVRKETMDLSIQLDIIKKVIDFTVCSIVGEALKCQIPWIVDNLLLSKAILHGHGCDYHKGNLLTDRSETVEDLAKNDVKQDTSVDSKCGSDYQNGSQNEREEISDISKEMCVILDFLCNVITFDWTKASCWSRNDGVDVIGHSEGLSLTSGRLDCSSWQPLHKWFVALYGALCCLIAHCINSEYQLQVKELCDGLLPYIQMFGTQAEKDWLGAVKDQTIVTTRTFCNLGEFQTPSGNCTLVIGLMSSYLSPHFPGLFIVQINSVILVLVRGLSGVQCQSVITSDYKMVGV